MTTTNTNEDKLILGGHEFTSRFIMGSGKFSLELMKACIEKAGAQIVTLALRRANEGGLANILDYVPKDVTLLPNTSGVLDMNTIFSFQGRFKKPTTTTNRKYHFLFQRFKHTVQ